MVGRTYVATSHEVVSEGVIVANSLQQDRHFWHIEAEATDQECPEWLKPLWIHPCQVAEVAEVVYCRPYAFCPRTTP